MERRVTIAAVACATLAVGAASCSGGGGSGGGPTAPSTQRVPVTTLNFPTSQPQTAGLQFTRAFPNVSFNRPTFLTAPPDGSNRIFVLEQGGRILVFPNRDDVQPAEVKVFLDIQAKVDDFSEQGLLGLAFDPDFATNGFFYVHYSTGPNSSPPLPQQSNFARFTVSAADPDAADPASESVFLTVGQPATNHNGGMLAFGPDGMLYASLGDGGGGGDQFGNAQNLGTLLGSMLRLDVSNFPGAAAGYRIPPDNPFVGVAGAREEIFAYGLRHPWRFSFDRAEGRIWLGDVGQATREEIDIIVSGGNYGWNAFEGNFQFSPGASPAGLIFPVFDYPRGASGSVTGGYVYRGSAVPNAVGLYFFAEFIQGPVWAAVFDGVGGVSSVTQLGTLPNISSFGEDAAGELYACSYGGPIYRLIDGGGAPPPATPFPQTLSDTGIFSDLATLTPNPGILEYAVNSPLWSDGTIKRRWLALPGISKMAFDATDAWQFPVGTVIVKHFELDLDPTDPSSTPRRLETRVLVNETGGWAGYTYKWRDTQDDADLQPDAPSQETYTVLDPSAMGGQRQQTYDYPSRTQCLQCHTLAAGSILGVKTRQLNRSFPGGGANQLQVFNDLRLFTQDIGALGQYDALVDPANQNATLADRARSYLDANCGMCHLPGGPAPGGFDLRFGLPVGSLGIVDVAPTAGDLGLNPPVFRVRSNVKESSVLWERIRRRDAVQMPPLATNEVDDFAVDLIGQWIDAGPPGP